MELDPNGRVAWICGATGAIGSATAAALAAEGVALALSARDEHALRRLADDIGSTSRGTVALFPLDVGSREPVDRAAARIVAEFGRIDLLVNTTASPIFGDFLLLPDADWEGVFQAKYFGYMRTMRAVIPHMTARGAGSIVNISGRGGHQPSSASHLPGSSANAAVNLLTKGLANIYGRQGIRINAVAPGPITSPRFDKIAAANQSIARLSGVGEGRAGTNFAGMGQPADIAAIVVFLASHRSAHLNGIVVQADGGSTASL